MNTKEKIERWDEVDAAAESYVSKLIGLSTKEIKLTGLSYDKDGNVKEDNDKVESAKELTVLEIGKEITEFAIKLLEERYGAKFDYVDESF